MDNIVQIDAGFIEKNTDFPQLISALENGFANKETLVPMRHHHDFPNPKMGRESTLLLMPAWHPGKEAGVKIATISPENGQFGLPAIQGIYIYLDALKGSIKAIIEAKSLTVKRTAAASALASRFLSRPDSKSLLMIGTGALSPNLILAHASVRPIEKVFVWGRNFDRAKAVCTQLKNENFSCAPIKNIADKISEVDIISAATLSRTPLIPGKFLRPGQHVDLVGAYRPDMREADDESIKKSAVFVDTFEGGLKESGDIVIPLKKGILTKEAVLADLFLLVSKKHKGRNQDKEITFFKSVGHALEDLAAANYYYNLFTDDRNL